MTMTRTQFACCCLIASAFILGGLVINQISDRLPGNEAHAEMVVSRDHLTMLTTRFQGDVELLYVLDGERDLLLVYEQERGSINLLGRMNLARVFANTEREPDQRRRGR